MKKNEMLFVKQLYFLIFLSLFGVLNLYAQDAPTKLETTHEEELSVLKDRITSFENDVSNLKESIQKTHISLENLFFVASKPQIWQIISAASTALIALLTLVIIVLLLLKQLRFNTDAADSPQPPDEKSQEEHLLLEDSKTVTLGISSAEFNVLKKNFDEANLQLRQLLDKVNSQSKDVSCFQSGLASFQAEMTDFKQKIKSTNDVVSLLKIDLDKNKEKIAQKEQVESAPIAVFNQWAQNPYQPLPQFFTFVANIKLELRTKQEFADTNLETEWIRNTIGDKKYLFPNPNKIDNLSGPIDKIYKMVGTRKAKGTNSVKITSACQIKEGNFIEYQGELVLM